MAKNIYVGNLSPATTVDELRTLFERYGEVDSVEIITDRYSGESRGFAFVKMNDQDGSNAIKELDQAMLGERNLKVNEARPRESGGMNQRGGRRRF
jgi:RNA recognition motif-containing protein